MPLQEKKPAAEPKRKQRGGIVYSEPAKQLEYRSSLEGWSPDRVKAAIGYADNGNLQELADLVEAMLADDRIGGVLSQRTHGLLGLPRAFVGGSEEVRGVLEGPPGPIPGEFEFMCPEEELLQALNVGLILGAVPVQIVPLPRTLEQKQRYRIEVWNPRFLTYYHRPVEGVTWYIQTQKGREKIIPGAGRWAIFTPYGSHRAWTKGLWRQLAFPWLLKRFALEDRANHSETVGAPTKVGKTAKGATEAHRQRFLAQIQGLVKRGTLILPEGYDYSLVESAGQTSVIYKESVDWSDAAITIAIAGQIVTTEGQSGFSEGKIFDSIKGDFIRFDGRRLSSWLHEQVFKPFCRANYDVADTPYLFYNTEKPVDLEVQSRTWQQVGASIKIVNEGLQGTGKRVDAVALCKQFNIPLIEVEEKKQQVTLTLAPTDAAKVVTVNEARSSQGLEDIEGERGELFISEIGTPADPSMPEETPPGDGKSEGEDPPLSQDDSVPTDKSE